MSIIQEKMAAGKPPEENPEEKAQSEQANADPSAVTPEEQKAYEQVVLAGIRMLTHEATHQQILQMLQQGAETPAEALTAVTAMIMFQVDEASGGTVPEVVIIKATEEIAENVAKFAAKAGFFEVNQAVLDKASQLLAIEISNAYGISLEDVQELMGMHSEEEINDIRGMFGVEQPQSGEQA